MASPEARIPTYAVMLVLTATLLALLSLTSPLSAQPTDTYESAVIEKALEDAQDSTLTQEGDLDVQQVRAWRDRYRRLTVPVTIDGEGPFRFLIDTGSQATVVTHAVSERLKLPSAGKSLLVATGSSRIVDMVELDALEFADRRFNGLTSPLLRRVNVGADGILGLDSLQDLRVLMDFRADTISVSDARIPTASNGYEIIVRARRKLGQMIITDARIDGIRTAVIIDTGANGSLGNMALEKRLRGKLLESMTATDVNGVQYSSEMKRARNLTIGTLQIQSVPIGFLDSPAFAALGLKDRPALILGMANLRMFDRIAIDFSTRRILFDLPDSAISSDAFRNKYFPSRL